MVKILVTDPLHEDAIKILEEVGEVEVATNLTKEEVQPKIKELVKTLFKNVPSGLGSKGILKFSKSVMDDVLEEGVRWAVKEGYGWKEDLEFIEEHGCLKDADASYVSDKAKERGRTQLGSLGSGNHFLEVQYVEKVFDEEAAEIYGIEENQVVVMVHTGSRGLGHQICTDYLRTMEKAAKNYGIKLPDRQLACAPYESEEGQSYFKAMCCGANYAWANRQMITHWVRESFEEVFKIHAEDLEMSIVYDVAHNIAKKEEHIIDGRKVKVIVHRKGATRAFPPKHEAIPKEYWSVGQPVIIPGDMGTASYLMKGTEIAMRETFGSNPKDIIAGVAPSIGACCYEVGEDVAKHFFDDSLAFDVRGEKYMLDLPYINRQQLLKAGLLVENIELSNICTACNVDNYFSYRKEQGCSGRFMSMIGLDD